MSLDFPYTFASKTLELFLPARDSDFKRPDRQDAGALRNLSTRDLTRRLLVISSVRARSHSQHAVSIGLAVFHSMRQSRKPFCSATKSCREHRWSAKYRRALTLSSDIPQCNLRQTSTSCQHPQMLVPDTMLKGLRAMRACRFACNPRSTHSARFRMYGHGLAFRWLL